MTLLFSKFRVLISFHWSLPLGPLASPSPIPSTASTAFFASTIQFGTASLQSVAALRASLSGISNFSPFSMMQGGTASVHFFKQTFAGAPLSQDCLRTLAAQQAFA